MEVRSDRADVWCHQLTFSGPNGQPPESSHLVVQIRHLHPFAAHSLANVGFSGATSKPMILVELWSSTFENGPGRTRDSNVEFAPLVADGCAAQLGARFEVPLLDAIGCRLAKPQRTLRRDVALASRVQVSVCVGAAEILADPIDLERAAPMVACDAAAVRGIASFGSDRFNRGAECQAGNGQHNSDF